MCANNLSLIIIENTGFLERIKSVCDKNVMLSEFRVISLENS